MSGGLGRHLGMKGSSKTGQKRMFGLPSSWQSTDTETKLQATRTPTVKETRECGDSESSYISLQAVYRLSQSKAQPCSADAVLPELLNFYLILVLTSLRP